MEFSGIIFLLVVGFYVGIHLLSKSSRFGTPCPFCKERGRINSDEIERDFLGAVRKRDDGLGSILNSNPPMRNYQRYMVTLLHRCEACENHWTTSTERLESNSLANMADSLRNLTDNGMSGR